MPDTFVSPLKTTNTGIRISALKSPDQSKVSTQRRDTNKAETIAFYLVSENLKATLLISALKSAGPKSD